ncbi:MAG: GDSL-type esterase/lipase family protein [Syntrophobacteraceae bacterium]
MDLKPTSPERSPLRILSILLALMLSTILIGAHPGPARGATAEGKATVTASKAPGEKSASLKKSGSVRKESRDRKHSVPRRQTRKRVLPARDDSKSPSLSCPTPPPGPCLSVLVAGDSLAVGVGMTLDNAFGSRCRVIMRKMGKVSSGLDSPRFYDWHSALREALDREKVDVLVVMLGANDAHNSPGTAAWSKQYESKFAELLRIPAEKRIKTLVVGLPPMRKEDFCQRVRLANEAIRNAARLYPETCAYIDSFSRFADEEGNFTDRIRWKGQWKTVRAGDGVHFTGTGYQLLSTMVADEALRRSSASAQGDGLLRTHFLTAEARDAGIRVHDGQPIRAHGER